MSKLSSSKRVVIALVIFNLITISGYGYSVFALKKLNQDSSLTANSLEFDEKRDTLLRSVRNVLIDTEDDIEELESYFIQSDGILDFIELLESTGKTSGVVMRIQSIKPEDYSDGDFSARVFVHLNADGKWSNINRFLSLIESLPYRIEPTEVNLSLISAPERAESEWSGTFRFSVIQLL